MKEPTFEDIMNHERKKWLPPEPVKAAEDEPKRRGRKPKKVEEDGA